MDDCHLSRLMAPDKAKDWCDHVGTMQRRSPDAADGGVSKRRVSWLRKESGAAIRRVRFGVQRIWLRGTDPYPISESGRNPAFSRITRRMQHAIRTFTRNSDDLNRRLRVERRRRVPDALERAFRCLRNSGLEHQ